MSGNPYYTPDELGLATVGEVELAAPDYSFDLFVVWRDKATGDFLWGEDHGCSCPSPFADTSLSDLERGNGHAAAAAIQAATEGNEYAQASAVDLIARVMNYPAPDSTAGKWDAALAAGQCPVCATGLTHTASDCPRVTL